MVASSNAFLVWLRMSKVSKSCQCLDWQMKDTIKRYCPYSSLKRYHRVFQISAGSSHSLALSTAGVIFAFGNGMFGQLGLGNLEGSKLPVALLMNWGRPLFVVAAGDHSVAVCQSRPSKGNTHAGLLPASSPQHNTAWLKRWDSHLL